MWFLLFSFVQNFQFLANRFVLYKLLIIVFYHHIVLLAGYVSFLFFSFFFFSFVLFVYNYYCFPVGYEGAMSAIA